MLSFISSLGYDVYHSKRKVTNTESGTRKWAIAETQLTMLLFGECEGFWDAGVEKQLNVPSS